MEWFNLSLNDRKEIIIQVSNKINLPPAAIEKDFWVIIALTAIFNTEFADHFVFKGGTSLSKAWGIIKRFSEDIDLAIDRSYFGFSGDLNRSQIKRLRKLSCKFIANTFKDKLSEQLQKNGIDEFKLAVSEFIDSDSDPLAIELEYQSVTEKLAYLQPKIIIEISSRSLIEPNEKRTVQSFIGTEYSDNGFADKIIQIPTVLPKKTLLEKLFLLHEEFQKPMDRPIRSNRMSRHLYDISKLIDSDFCKDVLNDQKLYNDIVLHRKKLTPLSWVNYENHSRKTLNFIPPNSIIKEWRKDYNEMKESMFYDESETFDDVLTKLKTLQKQFNQL